MLWRRSLRPSVTHLPCSSRTPRSRRTRCSGSELEAGRPHWGRFVSRLFCSWKVGRSPGTGQSPPSPAGRASFRFAGFHLWCPGVGRGPGTECQELVQSVSPGVCSSELCWQIFCLHTSVERHCHQTQEMWPHRHGTHAPFGECHTPS